jgi:predicted molibdopterin-dependent oxidoreductase YjgC
VAVVYVLDPGPEGSLGDVEWLVEARKTGRLPALICQGACETDLAHVADVVLPGAAWVEKDACYTNEQGRVQAASKAVQAPGEAVEDWHILTSVGVALGLPFAYNSSQEVRSDLARVLADTPAYAGLADTPFNRPISARDWLQGSNPMERWKWDVMFQDLPPVKGHNVQMESAPSPTIIPLQVIQEVGGRPE